MLRGYGWIRPVAYVGIAAVFLLAQAVLSCNEALCASLVSKCMLLKSCECDLRDAKNCTCCRDCHKCLAKLYTECCDCVEMCPRKRGKDNYLRASTVDSIEEPIPELFKVLTEEEDIYERWTVYTYPAHHDLLYFRPRAGESSLTLSENDDSEHIFRHQGNHHITIDTDNEGMNCTVAYFSNCMSLNMCEESCQSMGAARYRWFHPDGCCQCIGATCLHYGKGEALCARCPPPNVQHDDDGDNLYYEDSDHFEEDWAEEERLINGIPLKGEEQMNIGNDRERFQELLKNGFNSPTLP